MAASQSEEQISAPGAKELYVALAAAARRDTDMAAAIAADPAALAMFLAALPPGAVVTYHHALDAAPRVQVAYPVDFRDPGWPAYAAGLARVTRAPFPCR